MNFYVSVARGFDPLAHHGGTIDGLRQMHEVVNTTSAFFGSSSGYWAMVPEEGSLSSSIVSS